MKLLVSISSLVLSASLFALPSVGVTSHTNKEQLYSQLKSQYFSLLTMYDDVSKMHDRNSSEITSWFDSFNQETLSLAKQIPQESENYDSFTLLESSIQLMSDQAERILLQGGDTYSLRVQFDSERSQIPTAVFPQIEAFLKS